MKNPQLLSTTNALSSRQIVGVLENVVGAYVGTELKLTVALVLIIAVLVVRPSGMFGSVQVVRV